MCVVQDERGSRSGSIDFVVQFEIEIELKLLEVNVHNCLAIVVVALAVSKVLHVLQALISLLDDSAGVPDVECVRCAFDDLFLGEALGVFHEFVALCQSDQTVPVNAAVLP